MTMPLKNNSLRMIMLFLSLIVFAGCTSAQDSKDLKKMIDGGAYLVDVRTPQEFATGHVEGSVNIPVDEIASNLDKFKQKKDVIVFCRSGARSSKAKQILEQNGIENITNGGSWEDVQAIKNK